MKITLFYSTVSWSIFLFIPSEGKKIYFEKYVFLVTRVRFSFISQNFGILFFYILHLVSTSCDHKYHALLVRIVY
jgi:hypothetical protein